MNPLEEKKELLRDLFDILYLKSTETCPLDTAITVGQYKAAVEMRLEHMKPSLDKELQKYPELTCKLCEPGKNCLACSGSKLNIDGRTMVETDYRQGYEKRLAGLLTRTH